MKNPSLEQIILRLTGTKNLTKEKIDKIKRGISGRFFLPSPSTADLLHEYRRLLERKKISPNQSLESLLQKRAIRTLSGVAVVTVLTKPWSCPGRCVYCPQEPGMPKSYLKNEPAAQRAYLNKFDPYNQVISRLQMLYNNGHPTDKVELIVKGGSWQAYPWRYQIWFTKECFRAANNCHPERSEGSLETTNKDSSASPQNDTTKQLQKKLESEQQKNETATHRIIGLTLETRPDLITPRTIKQMRQLGCTRVELGVQHTDDKILALNKRGQTLAQTKEATRLLKNAGFKVDYHLMPQLPGSSPREDYKMIKQIFADPDLRPDMIKIYPCTVVKKSPLYNWYRKGKYKPYPDKKLIEMLIRVKAEIIPRYCRISRLIRDIPSTEIMAGNRVTNLRQVIQEEMKKRHLFCRCLRCREIGHSSKIFNIKYLILNIKLFTEKYSASGGIEYFLSYEDPQRRVVYAFCRLRISPSSSTAFLRELHTYGPLVSLGEKNKKASQHWGLGRKLLAEAEKIACQNGATKLSVIAGVGARNYYRKFGYRLKDTYLEKSLH